MHDFIGLLSIYYTCDVAAAQYQLAASEVMRCSLTYEAVKMQFLTGTEIDALVAMPGAQRATMLRAGYLRFKDWERAHPDIVESLRASNAGG